MLDLAKEVFEIEAEGILGLKNKLDDNFVKTIEIICNSVGRVVVSGVGKSGLIGRKIVATLNSTGTNSIFLHPVEAMHGDLGMVFANDVFLALSNSGETEELNLLVSSIKNFKCTIIAITGNLKSTLARNSNFVIDVGIEKEACPMGLAPTTSTTALLAMGDAIAVTLIEKKKIKLKDFKRVHPGGSLGKHLSVSVQEIMLKDDAIPQIKMESSFLEVIKVIDDFKLGIVFIVDVNKKLLGLITDGDVRKFIAHKKNHFSEKIINIMTKNPITIDLHAQAYEALNIIAKNEISVLPVINQNTRIEGILHIHDILGKGSFKFGT